MHFQARLKIEVTGFEPAAFWSRILSSVGQPILARPVESCCDRICSDGKAPSVGGFAWQTTGRMVPAVMEQPIRYSASLLVYAH